MTYQTALPEERYYRVYLTPRIGEKEFGDEVEISDRVFKSGLGTITKGFDSYDYGAGIYTFGDLRLKCRNDDGYLNERTDSRSVFTYIRDLSKIRVVAEKATITRDSEGHILTSSVVSTIVFYGLILEEAIVHQPVSNEIDIRVLSLESIFKRVKVSPGYIPDLLTTTGAIQRLLSMGGITWIIPYDENNIDPPIEFEIGNGSWFDNKTVYDAIKALLLATRSAIYLNTTNEAVIIDRSAEGSNTLSLYGPFTTTGRNNFTNIQNYNHGQGRLFTSVTVNEQNYTNKAYVKEFGFRKLDVDLGFLTEDEQANCARSIVETFKTPRDELSITMPKSVAGNIKLFDTVTIDHPFRKIKEDGKFYPISGEILAGVAFSANDCPIPKLVSQIQISKYVLWSIIEIAENLETFDVELKLRQWGKDPGEGYVFQGE